MLFHPHSQQVPPANAIACQKQGEIFLKSGFSPVFFSLHKQYIPQQMFGMRGTPYRSLSDNTVGDSSLDCKSYSMSLEMRNVLCILSV